MIVGKCTKWRGCWLQNYLDKASTDKRRRLAASVSRRHLPLIRRDAASWQKSSADSTRHGKSSAAALSGVGGGGGVRGNAREIREAGRRDWATLTRTDWLMSDNQGSERDENAGEFDSVIASFERGRAMTTNWR